MDSLSQNDTQSTSQSPGNDASATPNMPSRTALITGAGSGIGLALVDALLASTDYGRVYAGCRKPEASCTLRERNAEDPRLQVVELDVTDNASVAAAAEQMHDAHQLDLVINTAGVLHNVDGMRPEKRLAEINTNDLLRAYDVNALGAMRLAVELESLLKASKSARFVSLSARVGSIGDNQLGGWYAYRASKAALNMLLKTLAIEWSRARPAITCAAVHPGTVSTALSDPFTSNGYQGKVFTPGEAATQILEVIDGLGPDKSGGFYAWDGQEIPW